MAFRFSSQTKCFKATSVAPRPARCAPLRASSSAPAVTQRRGFLASLVLSTGFSLTAKAGEDGLPASEAVPAETELESPTLSAGETAVSVPEASLPAAAEADVVSPGPAEASVATADLGEAEVPAAAVQQAEQLYIDVRLEGRPGGRIVLELLPDSGVGGQRFRDLIVGKQGVGYRLSKFDGIFPDHISNAGVASLSYSAQGYSPIAGGDSVEDLEDEMDAPERRQHDAPGLVSLLVKESKERPITEKLVAVNGKFVTIKSQAGQAPNGTAFSITTAPCRELDGTNLVVARVVSGMELVSGIQSLPVNLKQQVLAPFFAAGQAIGDKRAVTAARAFNRPLKQAFIADSGIVE